MLSTARSVTLASVCIVATAGQARALVYDFKVIDPPGAIATYAYGISDAGQVVGRYAERVPGSTGGSYGFLDVADSFTAVNIPGASGNYGSYGVNNAGQIAGILYSDGENALHAVLRDVSGNFSLVDPPGATKAGALGINRAGDVVGSYRASTGLEHGFVRAAAGTFRIIDIPSGVWTEGWGINDRGQVSGTYSTSVVNGTPSDHRGFITDAGGTCVSVNVPGAIGKTRVHGINNFGMVVGSYLDAAGAIHGFVLAGDGFTILNPPGSVSSEAYGINDAWQVVGDYVDRAGVRHGYIANTRVAPNTAVVPGAAAPGCKAVGAPQPVDPGTNQPIVPGANQMPNQMIDNGPVLHGVDPPP